MYILNTKARTFSLRVPRGGLFVASFQSLKSKGVKFVLGNPMKRRKRWPIPLMALVRHYLTSQTRKTQVHTSWIERFGALELRTALTFYPFIHFPSQLSSVLHSPVFFFRSPHIPEQLINWAFHSR